MSFVGEEVILVGDSITFKGVLIDLILVGDFLSSFFFSFIFRGFSVTGRFFIKSAGFKLSSDGAEAEPDELFPSPSLIKSLFPDSSSIISAVID